MGFRRAIQGNHGGAQGRGVEGWTGCRPGCGQGVWHGSQGRMVVVGDGLNAAPQLRSPQARHCTRPACIEEAHYRSSTPFLSLVHLANLHLCPCLRYVSSCRCMGVHGRDRQKGVLWG